MSESFAKIARSGAVVSDCGKYRYRLTRRWSDGPTLTFVMLNPSTADADFDDPTIRRCVNFAKREGCGGLLVVNLFAFRATDPKNLPTGEDRFGPLNHQYMDAAIRVTDGPVIAAWGLGGADAGAAVIERYGDAMSCLGKTKDGHPRHPLYVKKDAPLAPLLASQIVEGEA